jgi:hypothetical protein
VRPSYATPFLKANLKSIKPESLPRFGSERFGAFMRKKKRQDGEACPGFRFTQSGLRCLNVDGGRVRS